MWKTNCRPLLISRWKVFNSAIAHSTQRKIDKEGYHGCGRTVPEICDLCIPQMPDHEKLLGKEMSSPPIFSICYPEILPNSVNGNSAIGTGSRFRSICNSGTNPPNVVTQWLQSPLIISNPYKSNLYLCNMPLMHVATWLNHTAGSIRNVSAFVEGLVLALHHSSSWPGVRRLQ
ncbi:uncharacterized protein EI90DRAFT_3033271 [Cantharellus anzutake]|uniref:uncharacterized protein n=1 Tax=Cantharellus anzutake TaxID=1750568 RepID=UPI001908659A|nr:uncharacterized protein EI90DRAFT_3033271 [Cantharellus anzutake]KAF8341257.1 hypothetical protein EI90DRAFT_3033271 [Cantharellus anzutake]